MDQGAPFILWKLIRDVPLKKALEVDLDDSSAQNKPSFTSSSIWLTFDCFRFQIASVLVHSILQTGQLNVRNHFSL